MNEEKIIKLTEQEVYFMVEVLATQPFNRVAGLIDKIVRQTSSEVVDGIEPEK